MLKPISLVIAMTLVASTASAFDWEAPTTDQNLGSKQSEQSVAFDRATLQRRSTGAHLGSDVVSAMPIMLATMTGTHIGVDMAAAYTIVQGENPNLQQAFSGNTGS